MKKAVWIIIIIAVVIGGGIVIYEKYNQSNLPPPPKIREYKVSTGDITVGVDGGMEISYNKKGYSFTADGTIEKIHIKSGDMINKGDILAELNMDKLYRERDKLNVDLQKAEISYKQTLREKELGVLNNDKNQKDFFYENYDGEEYDLSIDQAQINLSRVEKLEYTLSKEIKALLEQIEIDKALGNDVTELEMELADKRNKLEDVKLDVYNAEVVLKKLRLEHDKKTDNRKENSSANKLEGENTVSKLEDNIKLAEFELERIKRELLEVEGAIGNPKLIAEKSGIVTEVTLGIGELITSGKVLVKICEQDITSAKSTINQNEINKIKSGQTVEVRLEAYPDTVIYGEVNNIIYNPIKEGSNIYYGVEFILSSSELGIYDGMTGEANFIQKRKENVLRLSNKAIYFREGKQFVKIKNQNGVIEEKEIKTGFSDGKVTEIISGLNHGDITVVEG